MLTLGINSPQCRLLGGNKLLQKISLLKGIILKPDYEILFISFIKLNNGNKGGFY